jgi:hypothetical protein
VFNLSYMGNRAVLEEKKKIYLLNLMGSTFLDRKLIAPEMRGACWDDRRHNSSDAWC